MGTKFFLRVLLTITTPIWFIPFLLWVVVGGLLEDFYGH
jgi:hypothetical protein